MKKDLIDAILILRDNFNLEVEKIFEEENGRITIVFNDMPMMAEED